MSTAKYEAHLVIDPVTESPSDSSPSDLVTKFREFLKLNPKPTLAEIEDYVARARRVTLTEALGQEFAKETDRRLLCNYIELLQAENARLEGLLYGTGQATNQELMKLRKSAEGRGGNHEST